MTQIHNLRPIKQHSYEAVRPAFLLMMLHKVVFNSDSLCDHLNKRFREVCHCDIVYVFEITFETVDGIQGCAHLSSTFLCCG